MAVISDFLFLHNCLKPGIVAHSPKNSHTHACTLIMRASLTLENEHTRAQAHAFASRRTHTRASAGKFTHTRINSRTHAQNTCTRTHLHVHLSKCACANTRKHTHACTSIHACTSTHTCTSTHAHARTPPVII